MVGGNRRPFYHQVITGADVEVPACAHFRVSPGSAVAVVFACGGVLGFILFFKEQYASLTAY